MTANLPLEVYEGVIRTSPWRRLARITLKNTANLFRNRVTVAAMLLAGAVCVSVAVLGPVPLLGAAAILGLYRARHPVSFRRRITLPLWSCWLSVFKYRRQWRHILKDSGVIATFEDPPRILKVTATKGTRQHPGSVQTVRFRMNLGHTLAGNYQYNLAELVPAFNAVHGNIRAVDQKRLLELQLIIKDPLTGEIPHYPATAEQLHTGYEFAMGDDGEPWILKLPGTHIAVGGETGSGKGSVFWRIIRVVQPARRDGTVKLLGADHKGGVELGLGGEFYHDQFVSPYFDQFSYRSSRETVRMLTWMLREKTRRQKLMLGSSRTWEPGPDGDEHIVFLCDEIGALTAWEGDRKIRAEAAQKLALLINQARAFGISIVYAGQDLRKDIAVFRGQTPTRMQGRTPEVWDIDNMLGPGAWRQGAKADEILDSMPGTFYVAREGKAGYQKIRIPYETNDMITGKTPDYAEDVAAARVMAEAAAGRQQDLGITRFGGFA